MSSACISSACSSGAGGSRCDGSKSASSGLEGGLAGLLGREEATGRMFSERGVAMLVVRAGGALEGPERMGNQSYQSSAVVGSRETQPCERMVYTKWGMCNLRAQISNSVTDEVACWQLTGPICT